MDGLLNAYFSLGGEVSQLKQNVTELDEKISVCNSAGVLLSFNKAIECIYIYGNKTCCSWLIGL